MPAGLPAALEAVYARGSVPTEDGRELPLEPTGISRTDAQALAALAAQGGRRTLEVGLGLGLSAVVFAAAHAERGEGRHVAIDPHQARDFGGAGVRTVREAGLAEWVEVVEEPAEYVLPRLAAGGGDGERLGVAFVDGLHLYDQTLVEAFYLDRLLAAGGALVLHDAWMPAIRAAAAFLASNRAYEHDEDAGTENLIVLRKTGEDDRPWDHFVEPPRPSRGPLGRLARRYTRPR